MCGLKGKADQVRFCGRCGSKNARLDVHVDPEYLTTGAFTRARLTLTAYGPHEIEVTVGEHSSTASVAPPRTKVHPNRPEPLDVTLESPPTGSDITSVHISVTDNAGIRNQEKPWELSPKSVEQHFEVKFRSVKGDIEAIPSGLFFTDGLSVLSVRVALKDSGFPGQVPIFVSAHGTGFDLVHRGVRVSQISEPISSQTHCTFSVQSRAGTEPKGYLSIRGQDGTETKVKVLYVSSADLAQDVPPLCIGIDFGTSGTSVFVREHPNSWQEARALEMSYGEGSLEKSERWPTRFYLEGADRSLWKFGFEANLAEDLAKSDQKPRDSYRVEDRLKALLRDPQKRVEVPGIGQVEPRDILVWYFKQLKTHIAQQFRPQMDWLRHGYKCELYISLPVLDQKREYELQQSVTLSAAAEAFGPQFIIKPMLEPRAAATVLLLLAHSQSLFEIDSDTGIKREVTLNDGEIILVYDSGGGTTDIIIGEIKLLRSGPELRVKLSRSAVRASGHPYGGTSVTDSLAGGLFGFFSRAYPDLAPPENPFNVWARQVDNSDSPSATAFTVAPVPGQVEMPTDWWRRFPRSFFRLEDAKLQLSKTNEAVDLQMVHGDLGDTASLTPESLVRYCERNLDVTSQLHCIRSAVRDYEMQEASQDKKTISKVFLVGGNCGLVALRNRLINELNGDSLQVVVPQAMYHDRSGKEKPLPLNLVVPMGTCLAPCVQTSGIPYSQEFDILESNGTAPIATLRLPKNALPGATDAHRFGPKLNPLAKKYVLEHYKLDGETRHIQGRVSVELAADQVKMGVGFIALVTEGSAVLKYQVGREEPSTLHVEPY